MAAHSTDLTAVVMAFLVVGLSAGPAHAQGIKDVAGFYTLISIDNTRPDGTVVPQYGPNPKGVLSLDPSGRYVLFVRRNELESFASQNIREGTAAENRTVVRGSLAHSGTYLVDEVEKSITLRIEASTFPNMDRTAIKRAFKLTPNDLTYVMSRPTVGSGIATLVWRRVR